MKQPVSNQHGFTLIELMAVIGIIGTLAAIALTNFFSSREKAKITIAINDIRGIERTILSFRIDNNRLPDSLIEAGLGNPVDPWGNTYVYYPVTSVSKGTLRKDKSLVPINTDYDLYSPGRDKTSKAPLTAPQSHDDIIRANNGAFIGLAAKY